MCRNCCAGIVRDETSRAYIHRIFIVSGIVREFLSEYPKREARLSDLPLVISSVAASRSRVGASASVKSLGAAAAARCDLSAEKREIRTPQRPDDAAAF